MELLGLLFQHDHARLSLSALALSPSMIRTACHSWTRGRCSRAVCAHVLCQLSCEMTMTTTSMATPLQSCRKQTQKFTEKHASFHPARFSMKEKCQSGLTHLIFNSSGGARAVSAAFSIHCHISNSAYRLLLCRLLLPSRTIT